MADPTTDPTTDPTPERNQVQAQDQALDANSLSNQPTHAQKRFLMAHLFALGMDNRTIASQFDMGENRVSILRNSPLMIQFVARIQAHISQSMVDEYIQSAGADLDAIVPHAISRLSDTVQEADVGPTLNQAIKTVFDYAPNAPKSTKNLETTAKQVHTVSPEALLTIEKALARTDHLLANPPLLPSHRDSTYSDPIDVTPSPAPSPSPFPTSSAPPPEEEELKAALEGAVDFAEEPPEEEFVEIEATRTAFKPKVPTLDALLSKTAPTETGKLQRATPTMPRIISPDDLNQLLLESDEDE